MWTVDDRYLAGDSLMAARVIAGQRGRAVYLPAGEWVDYWTRERHSGKRRIKIEPPLELTLFVLIVACTRNNQQPLRSIIMTARLSRGWNPLRSDGMPRGAPGPQMGPDIGSRIGV
jgi:hypothetical protein